MMDLNNKIVNDGYNWVTTKDATNISSDFYCPTRDIFIARLEKLQNELSPLLIAVIGEIGNNSFDHNLGSWQDIPGIYFSCDLKQKIVVLADRGQGIKTTIQKVKPEIKNDLETLKVAFTEKISGRSPEKRGNGLKFTVKVVETNKWELYFHSGKAIAKITKPRHELVFENTNENINGTIAAIKY